MILVDKVPRKCELCVEVEQCKIKTTEGPRPSSCPYVEKKAYDKKVIQAAVAMAEKKKPAFCSSLSGAASKEGYELCLRVMNEAILNKDEEEPQIMVDLLRLPNWSNLTQKERFNYYEKDKTLAVIGVPGKFTVYRREEYEDMVWKEHEAYPRYVRLCTRKGLVESKEGFRVWIKPKKFEEFIKSKISSSRRSG